MDKPNTREDMIAYMRRIGVCEGFNLHADIVENGWAENEAEAGAWLASLGITPWEE